MPLNLAKVGLAVQNGLSSVCATCTLYWIARDQGVPGHKCLAQDGCGSPISGDDFHEYQGPISDLSRWCFVCGSDATRGLRVGGRFRVVGVCENHLRFVHGLRSSDSKLSVTVEVDDGTCVVPVDRLFRKSPSKLLLSKVLADLSNGQDPSGQNQG
jgi:hypothetical protein